MRFSLGLSTFGVVLWRVRGSRSSVRVISARLAPPPDHSIRKTGWTGCCFHRVRFQVSRICWKASAVSWTARFSGRIIIIPIQSEQHWNMIGEEKETLFRYLVFDLLIIHIRVCFCNQFYTTRHRTIVIFSPFPTLSQRFLWLDTHFLSYHLGFKMHQRRGDTIPFQQNVHSYHLGRSGSLDFLGQFTAGGVPSKW